MADSGIGKRIKTYRLKRGLSQTTLACLVGRSESWLSQVERGVRSVDRMSVILDLARVLHVDADELLNRPWQLAPNGSTTSERLGELRAAFMNYNGLVGERELGPVELLSYVAAYVVAAKLVTKLGASDLAALASDRAATAAMDVDSKSARGLAAYQVACALLRADQVEEAESVAVRMAERLAPYVRSDDPVTLSAAGALWLIAAVAAGRRTDVGNAYERLRSADELAGLLGHDSNHGWTAFGPTNVAIHRVSVAAELGDASGALRAATAVDTDRMPPELLSRRAQVQLDLAWAQSQRRRDAEATLHLMEAERIAPQVVRHNVIVQEIMREMLARGKQGKTTALYDLARRSGVLQ